MSIASELAGIPNPRLLLVRLDNIGDVVLLSPAVRALKESLPGCAVTLWTTKAGAQAAPLLEGVDDIMVSRPIWQELGGTSFDPEDDRRIIAGLRSRDFHAAFIFTSFSQTPHPAALVCSLAGIPRRAGNCAPCPGGELLFEAAPPPFAAHQAERNLSLLEQAGFPAVDRSLRLRIPGWKPPWVRPGCYVVVSPWASCAARSYPAGRMLEAAQRIAGAQGWQVLLVGRDSEAPCARRLMREQPQAPRSPGRPGAEAIDLVGLTTVSQLAALIAGAGLVLCNNTLAMHLAEATRTPCVVTYAGTDLESQWEPRYAPHRLLRRETACAPCFLFTCPCGHPCLDIPPEEVAAESEALLAESGGRLGAASRATQASSTVAP